MYTTTVGHLVMWNFLYFLEGTVFGAGLALSILLRLKRPSK